MTWRLHRGGRWRTWLGRALGGDPELGDRAWRRIVHGSGAGVLLYYVAPPGLLFGVPNAVLVLAALALVVLLEVLRHYRGLELPTLRSYESGRVASYVYYALALALAVLVFPEWIAVVVVLGTAFVDPLAGELRNGGRSPWITWGVPLGVYFALAFVALRVALGHSATGSLLAAALAAVVAVIVERPRHRWYDDDLAMTLVPAVLLYVAGLVAPGFP